MAATSSSLVERVDELAQLTDRLAEVTAGGEGQIVLIGGEAGAGKTSLVREFASAAPARFLTGGSEPLRTPRAHGPLLDIAAETGGDLERLVESRAGQTELVRALAHEVAASPTVLVFEDLHWADEATLDLLRIVARRLRRVPALILGTYRDDELSRTHPLRILLGELATEPRVHRVGLPALSVEGVAALVGNAPVPARGLHELTGGNPFFVTEILAAGTDQGVPDTLRDAVLARVARLPGLGRHLLDAVAVVPARAELWLLEAMAPLAVGSLETCLASGALQADREAVRFRHEIARVIVEEAIPPDHAHALHRRALEALVAHEPEVDPARIVHHAIAVGDAATVLHHAPVAAERASSLSAHREAVAHLESALRYADQLPRSGRVALLERHAYECYLTNQMAAATASRRLALAEHVAAGDLLRQGDTHRWLSRLAWFQSSRLEADAEARRAVELLEQLPDGHELAMAYSNMGQLRMLGDDTEGALEWSNRAAVLAEEIGDREILSHALNNAGSAELLSGDPAGARKLERSLEIARADGLEEHVARALTNLASSAVGQYDVLDGLRRVREGIDYCTEHDLDAWRLYLTGWLARGELDSGVWVPAEQHASEVLAHPGSGATNRINPLLVLGLVRARRGVDGAWSFLDEARDLARGADELQRLIPTAAARAEVCLLEGREEEVAAETDGVLAKVRRSRASSDAAVILGLRRRAGLPSDGPVAGLRSPWALELDGRADEAADAWGELGLPYERAWCLVVSNDEDLARAGLVELQALGAEGAVTAARRILRRRGVRGLARGPRAATARTAHGLTPRQLEVLGFLVGGLRNAEIADRMVVSERTVDHHVSAVLQKLGVQSRTQAVLEAERQGLVPVE